MKILTKMRNIIDPEDATFSASIFTNTFRYNFDE